MPRIEYTLSFENYLEMTKFRHKRPDYKMAKACAFVGFSCIIAGYAYLRIWSETRPIVGLILLMLGLLATFLAMPLALFAKRKNVRPDTTKLRKEYDLFHADKRALEFDEVGWRVFWYDGEDVRPWSSLRAVQDLKTLLVISTQTTPYWLPKDALEREGQMDKVKSLAERWLNSHEPLFSVRLRPSPFVYVLAMYFHNWARNFKSVVLWYSAGTLLVYWIFFSGWDVPSSHSPWLLFLAPVGFYSCEGMYYLRNYCFANWSEAAQEVEIMSDCISYKTATAHMIATYRKFMNVRDIPGAFLLYFSRGVVHIIPKRGFSREQLLQFKKLVFADREIA